jgi:hypothetical protein
MRLGYDSIVQESIALTLIENKMLIIQSNDDVLPACIRFFIVL